jgi:chitodextrinase
LALALVFGGPSPAATPTPLVGNAAVEANADSDAAGQAEAFQATAGSAGTATDVYVYLDTAAPSKLVAGLYADASGHPGTLLAQGTLTAPKGAAWNDVPLASNPAVAAGTKYWIALLSPSGSGTVKFRDRKASGAAETSSATSLASLPASWQTGSRYTDGFVSAYLVAGAPDTAAPSAPGGVRSTGATASTIGFSWTASTDNVAVTGYGAYLDGAKIGTTQGTTYTVSVACSSSHTFGVEAYDAAGNTSQRSTATASSAPCPDTTPPTAPGSFVADSVDASSISTSWTASSDDVGVAGYAVSLNGRQVSTTTATSFTFASLACGTTYTAGVQAFDAAGNLSGVSTLTATTPVCTDNGPPSAPPNFVVVSSSATSISTMWSAATDDVGVAGYDVFADGTRVATVGGTSYTFGNLTCGALHTIEVSAFDAAGNSSPRSSISSWTSACPDTTPPAISLTAPDAGTSLTGTVSLSASASDAGSIASVRFLVDGAAVGPVLTSPPFTWAWNSQTTSNGDHRFSAIATDAAGNTATAAEVAATVSNPFDTTNALKAVAVGPGFVDASTREVIRTSSGRVYMFVADDTAQRKGTGPGVMHAYRADQTGIPTSFSEVDALNRPSATGSTHVVGSPDVRLDRSNRVHLVYIDNTNNNVVYQTFSVISDTWGPKEVLGTNGSKFTSFLLRVGNATLVLDDNDVPRVVYSTGTSLVYRSRAGGSWSAPVVVSTGGTPIHPQLAMDASGTLHLAWLQDGTAPTIHYKSLPAGGSWSADETVASGDVLNDSNSDQGPSIVVSGSGIPYVLYVSAQKGYVNAVYGAVRIAYRSNGWKTDATPTDLLTHTPQIYAQGDDVYAFLGHDTSIHFGYAWQASAPAGPWSSYTTLYSGTTVDGSASIRWDPQRETNPNVIDAGFFDEDINDDKTYLPRAYYVAVLPRGGQPSRPADTTPPSVAVTGPSGGASVWGPTTVSASASDDVGVVGVQFKLDGALLGSEDATAPYGVSWDASTAAAGTHQLTAVARDAAGNVTTSAPVTVTVTPPPDTTKPTVSITAPSSGATVSGTVSIAATASDNVGVASVRFAVDGTSVGTTTAAPYSASWNSGGVADGTHTITATAADAAGNTASASVTVTVSNSAPAAGVTVKKVMEGSDTDRKVHTFTLPTGVPAGHTILLAHASTVDASDGGIVTPNGVTDSAGNTWHQDAVAHIASTYTTVEVWSATVTSSLPAGATLTIQGYARGLSDEFGLFDITGITRVDKSASAGGYGVYNSPSIATTTAHELLIGVHAQSSATAPWWTPETTSPAWTKLVDRFDGGNISRGIAVQVRELTTAGSYRSGGKAKQTVTASNLVVAYRTD